MTDKAWALVQTREPVRREIAGHGVIFKQLNNGEKVALAIRVSRLAVEPESYDKLMQLVGNSIIRIEGVDGVPAEIVPRLEDMQTQKALLDMVMELNGLNEDEAGNLQSQSDVWRTTGMPAATATDEKESASSNTMN